MKHGFYIDQHGQLAIRYEDGSWDLWSSDTKRFFKWPAMNHADRYAKAKGFEPVELY